ncbi:MAG: stage V sporulation protein AD [Clostridia bacterium]|nr:stage V sporulation protein AD [Clostridia bacterium]
MKIGKQTIKFENTPIIRECGSVVGPKEKSGPLSGFFDTVLDDVYFGEDSFEKAESKLIQHAVNMALNKSKTDIKDIEYMFSGDLLNQCISSGYALRELQIPFFGLYGACSTFSEANILAASFVNAGYATNCIAAASSHFCSAERQFRLPLEQGTQTPPTGQWTVTGSGATLISNSKEDKLNHYPKITYATPGKVIDMGITDIANMGAAMAPAAFDTIITHLEDTGRDANYYDLIVTGDLGKLGSEILIEQLQKYGIDISHVHNDCGLMIFDCSAQDTKAGGSGCGCSASVFSGFIYKKLLDKSLNKVLLISTGALMSPVSLGQGESIPSIAHAVAIENI